jgi:NitT/TauT family transport system substrate-binding protein
MVASLSTGLFGCKKEEPAAAKATGQSAQGGASAKPAESGAAAPAATGAAGASGSAGGVPSFSLAWSEYPSWSVFGVASEVGLIDGAKGKMGSIEKKHNVDIELRQADYDPCLQMYASAAVDAVCITNMDALNPSLSRKSVMILPTSTSNGGDALIAVGVSDIKQLRKPRKVYGLTKSVSEYAFVRGLIKKGEDPRNYELANMDPGAASQAMQTNQAGIDAIMVWNPFVLQTLKTRPEAKVVFDSSLIPGEIIDSVVMSADALGKPGGEAFARAVAEAFYAVCARMNDPKTADETYVALGAKFSSLSAAEMRVVCTQTKFYASPAEATALLTGKDLQGVMKTVSDFCVQQEIVPKAPVVAFGTWNDAAHAKADLVIDASFVQSK